MRTWEWIVQCSLSALFGGLFGFVALLIARRLDRREQEKKK